ncbi:glycosyltransferase involved in cell wall biosynthesis [Aeromonas salmonicida]|uniref:glycosyltransferase n=1 Tax=Aeromonas salmonicida TaxID=645 RepID=UPI002867245B|nr:glycosyltransferase [Aeromonas salmonicida]MDR6994382.1 glycosyltransferase involved in cell wall biosynthesis [Aeromonas salmonicida]
MSSDSDNISVLISVFSKDDPRFLDVALRSIHDDQTIKPEQIVIVADGPLLQIQSTIIDKFSRDCAKEVVTFLPLTHNVGLATALNEGLKKCRNNLVARMDADDISQPLRFEQQLKFMRMHPEIDICGTFVDEIDTDTGKYISTRKVPLSHDEIVSFAKKRSPINHPSVMFKKNTVLAVGGYPEFRKSQDFALWSLLIVKHARFANINEVLLKMRTGHNMMDRRGFSYLKFECQVMRFQHEIGFITTRQFIIFVSIRAFFRILPKKVKTVLYGIVRKYHG